MPALKRDHPDAWALSVLNVVLGDGMSSRLFLGVREEKGLAYDVSSGIVEYADAGALEISAGVDPVQLPAAIGAILEEVARMIDEPVGEVELAKAKAYLAGGLELRMDDSRHLASWIGGQEALHDRVYTLDEALEAVEAVRPEAITKLARRAVHRRRPADGGGRPGEAPARAREAPQAAPMTELPETMVAPDDPVVAAVDGRRASLRLARVHLRLGSLSLARAELEALGNRDALDDDGLLDLAEARWRTGDLAAAGEAASAVVDRGRDDTVALVIAAEARGRRGPPGRGPPPGATSARRPRRAARARVRRHAPQLDLAR